MRSRAVLVGAMLLTACAGNREVETALPSLAVPFPAGRLTIVLTGVDGRPFDRATVNITSTGPDYYRTIALSDGLGRVSFSGLPELIRVDVYHPSGTGTRAVVVPQHGTTELRLVIPSHGR